MNAPLRHQVSRGDTAALNLFAFFHLNLAFSSIEESQRDTVIQRCYWPLLEFARNHGPIGIEATGFTLEEIAKRDPAWIDAARALVAAKRVELIGSGYAQIIGPLVPAGVSEANLRIGTEIYRRLLGARPEIALVNEQAYSSGLVGLYLDAGYRAILMDWDNSSTHHPEWPAETRYRAQRAEGSDGRTIGLLWTNTVAFQKLQRFVHGDIELEEYLEFARSHRGTTERVLCAYASDGEIFDFRPGRYRTEENISAGSEWLRMSRAFDALARETAISLVTPGEALATMGEGVPLQLGTAACPIPVKKQRKYNLSRWAVTGRDDLAINAACQRIHDGLRNSDDEAAWKELCYLWSSDFRTHITESRWQDYRARLEAGEARWSDRPAASEYADLTFEPVTSRQIAIETPSVSASLDRRRGLALSTARFAGHPVATIGGLPHGHFDDISLQADWYTGDCVFEAPGEHKVTDLEWAESLIATSEDGTVVVKGTIATPKGPIEKVLVFHATKPQIDFDLTFHWEDWGKGSLRLGHFTLLPDAFDWQTLLLTTHNGGKECESFRLAGREVDHGAPVSFLVSASHGIGMTEGWAALGDASHGIRVEVERSLAPLLGLVTHRRVGGSLFCQLALSALELDDTRKPSDYRTGTRHFRFSVKAQP